MRKSAWQRGVDEYADELRENLRENRLHPTEENMLNGAKDWYHYSRGASSLVSNQDIAERLSSPSELKKTNFGERNPNAREDWLDVQARALIQASKQVLRESARTKKKPASAYHQTAIARDIANVKKRRS